MSTEALGGSETTLAMADRVVVLTHARTTVLEILPIPIPFPRDQIETKELPEFAHLRAHVYRLIKRDEGVAPTQSDVEPVAERSDG